MNAPGPIPPKILATGGAGYIGSHVVIALLERGFDVVVLDDYSNSHEEAARRINRLSRGRRARFLRGDVCNAATLEALFRAHRFDAVVHFAGLKAVADSVARPEHYYGVNIAGAACLLAAMARHGVERLVFSSSATVYGLADTVPIPETAPLRPANPYGRTKHMIETMLADVARARPGSRTVMLRYFNPVGAHPSGLIGEDPVGEPANLFPLIARSVQGGGRPLSVFGTDYDTPDGTCIRDYIHVEDLAEGHVAALDKLLATDLARGEALPVNLGVGRGVSVREAIAAFERVSGQQVRTVEAPRRPGDVAECVADPARAMKLLNWHPRRDLDAMCRDMWRWRLLNPDGYRGREVLATAADEMPPIAPVPAGEAQQTFRDAVRG
ncbi:UDP-glucose 4-epimerase GalE [Oceaniglobus roseus]|uniref:UDP-glucose 4-epimerase GalE n=1 Tax=Oceaniglobus roseus TaxID=1737570 RepID=UPI001FE9270D|nr:UDP-glucose 4-epimerase GalE [Kandeliimicrobium roseum]